jgi:predicted nucleic acid-binding protein
MTVVVMDSSVLIASMLSDEPLSGRAFDFIQSHTGPEYSICAPQLLRSEVAAVLRKAVFTNRITHSDGSIMLRRALASPITFYEDEALLLEAYELAQRFHQPRTYDAQYLALADRLHGDFWTTDERLVNSIKPYFSRIHWLGAYG